MYVFLFLFLSLFVTPLSSPLTSNRRAVIDNTTEDSIVKYDDMEMSAVLFGQSAELMNKLSE